jgi:hypothetical protein
VKKSDSFENVEKKKFKQKREFFFLPNFLSFLSRVMDAENPIPHAGDRPKGDSSQRKKNFGDVFFSSLARHRKKENNIRCAHAKIKNIQTKNFRNISFFSINFLVFRQNGRKIHMDNSQQ